MADDVSGQQASAPVPQPQPSVPEQGGEKPQGEVKPEGEKFDAEYVAGLLAENARIKSAAKDGAAAIARLAAIEESQKSDAQKAAEALAKAQGDAAAAGMELRRLRVALSEGVPADLIDFIGDGDDEQILSRAKRLAQLAKVEQATKTAENRPGTMRPIEDLKPGALPSGQAPADDSYPAHWLPKR